MSEHFAKLFQNNSEADSVGRIEGNLPNWLMSEVNQVIYNGPVGIWDHPNQTANHWFDGLSILTSFIIDGPGKEVKMKKRCSISNFLIQTSFFLQFIQKQLLSNHKSQALFDDIWQVFLCNGSAEIRLPRFRFAQMDFRRPPKFVKWRKNIYFKN